MVMREYHLCYTHILEKWTMRSLLMMSDIILERYGVTSSKPAVKVNHEAQNAQAVSMLVNCGVAKIG
jgi:hypothetical protein